MLFQYGQIVATPGAMEFADEGISLEAYLIRHLSGDWGDLSPEDKVENQFSLEHGYRLLSSYDMPTGKHWIITSRKENRICPPN